LSSATVLLELTARGEEAQLATLTVSNESRLNCLESGLLAVFEERIRETETVENLRVVVLQGAGERAFIGGADVNELAELDAESARRYITSVHRVCQGLRDLPVPVIARIQGYCLGAGLEIAASCDLRVATEQSQFGMPEVQLGVPSVIEAALLPQLIGWGRTRELLFGGKSFMAREVADWGLVERVTSRDRLDLVVEEWVESIVRAGPRAIRLQKKLIRDWERLPLAEAIAAGIESFVDAFATDEPRERARGFLDRRRADKKQAS